MGLRLEALFSVGPVALAAVAAPQCVGVDHFRDARPVAGRGLRGREVDEDVTVGGVGLCGVGNHHFGGRRRRQAIGRTRAPMRNEGAV